MATSGSPEVIDMVTLLDILVSIEKEITDYNILYGDQDDDHRYFELITNESSIFSFKYGFSSIDEYNCMLYHIYLLGNNSYEVKYIHHGSLCDGDFDDDVTLKFENEEKIIEYFKDILENIK